jgi:hypothetical protein
MPSIMLGSVSVMSRFVLQSNADWTLVSASRTATGYISEPVNQPMR